MEGSYVENPIYSDRQSYYDGDNAERSLTPQLPVESYVSEEVLPEETRDTRELSEEVYDDIPPEIPPTISSPKQEYTEVVEPLTDYGEEGTDRSLPSLDSAGERASLYSEGRDNRSLIEEPYEEVPGAVQRSVSPKPLIEESYIEPVQPNPESYYEEDANRSLSPQEPTNDYISEYDDVPLEEGVRGRDLTEDGYEEAPRAAPVPFTEQGYTEQDIPQSYRSLTPEPQPRNYVSEFEELPPEEDIGNRALTEDLRDDAPVREPIYREQSAIQSYYEDEEANRSLPLEEPLDDYATEYVSGRGVNEPGEITPAPVPLTEVYDEEPQSYYEDEQAPRLLPPREDELPPPGPQTYYDEEDAYRSLTPDVQSGDYISEYVDAPPERDMGNRALTEYIDAPAPAPAPAPVPLTEVYEEAPPQTYYEDEEVDRSLSPEVQQDDYISEYEDPSLEDGVDDRALTEEILDRAPAKIPPTADLDQFTEQGSEAPVSEEVNESLTPQEPVDDYVSEYPEDDEDRDLTEEVQDVQEEIPPAAPAESVAEEGLTEEDILDEEQSQIEDELLTPEGSFEEESPVEVADDRDLTDPGEQVIEGTPAEYTEGSVEGENIEEPLGEVPPVREVEGTMYSEEALASLEPEPEGRELEEELVESVLPETEISPENPEAESLVEEQSASDEPLSEEVQTSPEEEEILSELEPEPELNELANSGPEETELVDSIEPENRDLDEEIAEDPQSIEPEPSQTELLEEQVTDLGSNRGLEPEQESEADTEPGQTDIEEVASKELEPSYEEDPDALPEELEERDLEGPEPSQVEEEVSEENPSVEEELEEVFSTEGNMNDRSLAPEELEESIENGPEELSEEEPEKRDLDEEEGELLTPQREVPLEFAEEDIISKEGSSETPEGDSDLEPLRYSMPGRLSTITEVSEEPTEISRGISADEGTTFDEEAPLSEDRGDQDGLDRSIPT